jgi:hypothetical protein
VFGYAWCGVFIFQASANAGLVQTIVQTTQQSNKQKYNNEVQPGHLVALRHHVCPPLPLEWRSRDLAHPIATKRELEETADAEKVGSFLFANILQRCSVCRAKGSFCLNTTSTTSRSARVNSRAVHDQQQHSSRSTSSRSSSSTWSSRSTRSPRSSC